MYNYTHSHKTTKYFFQMFFKDMNFSKPFQTDALGLLSYPAVRIKNHMIIFLSYFPFPSRFFYGFEEKLFWNFQKIAIKKQRDGVYIFLRHRSQELRQFLGNFLGFPELNSRTTASELFNIFSLNFSIVHFCVWSHLPITRPLWKAVINFKKV